MKAWMRVLLVALAFGGFAGRSHAANWASMATVSSTMGLTQNAMCVGGGDSTDVGCPLWAPILSSNGDVSASGVVRATQFIGDGSGLTGVVASTGDRIVSGTTSMVAFTDTGLISVTQAGVNTAYFHPSLGLVTVGVSSTGGISGTTGYFTGNVGIGTTAPSATLHVYSPSNLNMTTFGGLGGAYLKLERTDSLYYGQIFVPGGNETRMRLGLNGTSTLGVGKNGIAVGPSYSSSASMAIPINGLITEGAVGVSTSNPSTTLHVSGTVRISDGGEVCDADRAGAIKYGGGVFSFCDGVTGWRSLAAAAAAGGVDRIVSGTTSVVANSNGYISLTTGNVNTGYFDTAGVLVAPGVSSTGGISGTTGYFSGLVNAYAIQTTSRVMVGIGGVLETYLGGGMFRPYSAGKSIYLGSGVNAPVLTVTSDSRVGIGRTAPSATLDVSGSLKVAGTGSESCDATTVGSLRRNPLTGRMQICQ